MNANLTAKILPLMLILCLTFCAMGPAAAAGPEILAQGDCGDSATWALDSAGTLTISGSWRMKDYDTDGRVPWYPERESVKRIIVEPGITTVGKHAFHGCVNATSVSLPDSLQKIEQYAFSDCEKLKELRIPDSVSSMGYWAFARCSALKSITFSARLASIPMQAFMRCESLETLALPDTMESLDSRAFEDCSKLKSVDLGNGVTSIGENAFKGCWRLQTVTAGNGLERIGKMAFNGCWQLKTVTVGNHLQTIQDNAFNGCEALTEIVLPGSLSSLGSGVLNGHLTDVWFGGTEKQWNDLLNNTGANWNNDELKRANIHFAVILYYDANGGGGSMTPTVLEPGGEGILPENGFTPPAGMIFSGWLCDGKAYQPGDSLKAESGTTVTAQWVEKAPGLEDLTLDGSKVTVAASAPENAAVWCAVYDADGRMLEVRRPDAAAQGTLLRFTFSPGFASAKAFLLDADCIPLCGCAESEEGR